MRIDEVLIDFTVEKNLLSKTRLLSYLSVSSCYEAESFQALN